MRNAISGLRPSGANHVPRSVVRPALLLVTLVLLCLLMLGLLRVSASQDDPAPAQARPLVLTDERGKYPLGLRLEILEDPSGGLDIKDVAAPPYEARFVASRKKTPNFGITRSAYWARFQVRNEASQTPTWRLALSDARMGYVDLYLPGSDPGGGGWVHKRAGRLLPFAAREITHPQYVFSLPLPHQEEQVIYLRFQSNAAMGIPLTLWSPEAFGQHNQGLSFRLGLYYGIISIMIVFNLFLLISLREASYLYFVLFTACFLLNQASRDGMAHMILWPAWPNRYGIEVFGWLSIIFVLKFTAEFLSTRTRAPRLHKTIYLWIAMGVIGLFLTRFVWIITAVLNVYVLTTITLVIAVAVHALLRGFAVARLYLAAWMSIFVVGVVFMLTSLGILPASVIASEGPYVAMVLLVTLLGLALADRINLLKAETDQANRELRESEHRMTQILEAMPVGVTVRGADTRLRYVNQRARQLRSLTDGPVDIELDSAPTWEDNITDAPLYVAGTGQLYPLKRLPPVRALGGERTSVDDVEMDLGGRRIPLQIWSSPVFDERGRVKYAVSAFQDIVDRVRAEARIRDQLAVEEMLAAVSTRFVQSPDLDGAILKTLEEVGRLLAFDRLFLVSVRPDQSRMDTTHEWCALGVPSLLPELQAIPLADVPWLVARLEAGETIYIEDVSQLPPEAWREKDFMEKHLAGRRCALPIRVDAQLAGFLACHSYSEARLGLENERRVLETVAAMISGALQRATALETLEQRVADRTLELSTLYRVTSLTSTPLPLGKTLARGLDAVLAALDSPAGAIHLQASAEPVPWLVAHQGLPPEAVAELEAPLPEDVGWNWVLAHNRPLLLLKDLCDEPQVLPLTCMAGFQAYLGVPIQVQGQPGGVLSVFDTTAEGFTPEDMALLTTIADQLGTAVESDRLRGQAEAARLAQERQRLARDLHDAVSQSLYSLTLFAEAAREVLNGGQSDRAHQYLEQIKGTAHQALKEMRLLIYQLRPAALATEGLAGALQRRLEAVERRAGIEARLITHNGDLKLPPPLEDTLYRLAQEALNNVLKHAEASQVAVDLSVDDGWVELVVCDNGRGFDPESPPDLGGMGLANMRQRVEEAGGTLAIASTPGQGTLVKVRIGVTASPVSEGEVAG